MTTISSGKIFCGNKQSSGRVGENNRLTTKTSNGLTQIGTFFNSLAEQRDKVFRLFCTRRRFA
jgi:hypothetical protein